MARETKKAIKAKLLELKRETLVAFARSLKLILDKDDSIEGIATKLIEQQPALVEESVGEASLIHIKVIQDEINAIRNRANWIKVVRTIALASVTLLGAIYALFKSSELASLSNKVTEVTKSAEMAKTKAENATETLKKLNTELETTKNDHQSLVLIYRKHLINRITDDYRTHLEDLSFAPVSDDVFTNVRKSQRLLEQFKTVSQSPDEKVLNILDRLSACILRFERHKGTGHTLATRLEETEMEWSKLESYITQCSLNENVSEEELDFVKKAVVAYCKNVRSVCILKRDSYCGKVSPREFQNARILIDEAIELKGDFSRPYVNRSNIRKYDYLSECKKWPSNKRTKDKWVLLEKNLAQWHEEADQDLIRASRHSRSASELLRIFNNQADWCVIHAKFLIDMMIALKEDSLELDRGTCNGMARDELNKGMELILSVKGLTARDPAILITEAEWRWAELALRKIEKDRLFTDESQAGKRREEYLGVITLFSNAKALKYDWELSPEDFYKYLETETCAAVLSDLLREKDYKRELAVAGGVIPK